MPVAWYPTSWCLLEDEKKEPDAIFTDQVWKC